MKAKLLQELSRAMECAGALGIAGYSTSELEELLDEVQEANEVSDELLLAVITANRWHYDDDPERLFIDETALTYSFTFSFPQIFDPSEIAGSAQGLSVSNILRLLEIYWEDNETFTNRWIGYLANNPGNANWADLAEDSDLMTKDSNSSGRPPLGPFEVLEDQFGEVARVNLSDVEENLPVQDIVWHLRRFSDLIFLRDGFEPSISFTHYRAFEVEEGDTPPFNLSVPTFQEIDISIRPAQHQRSSNLPNSIEFLSQVRIFADD